MYNSKTARKSARKDSAVVSISQLELNELQSKNRNLEAEVKHLNSVLEDMRNELRTNSQKMLKELETVDQPPRHCVAGVKCADDEMYFGSYSHFEIHHEMLRVRYCEFISCVPLPLGT